MLRWKSISLLKMHLLPNVLFVTLWEQLVSIDCSHKKLLMAAFLARQKYMAYLGDEKKKRESSGRGE